MTDSAESDPPLLQRLYDRIWWIAAAALLWWFFAYVVWGVFDVFSIPGGPA